MIFGDDGINPLKPRRQRRAPRRGWERPTLRREWPGHPLRGTGADFLFAGYFDARESMYGGAGADTFAVLVRADGQLEDYIRDLGSSDRKQLIYMDPPARSSQADPAWPHRTLQSCGPTASKSHSADLYRLGEGSLERRKSVLMSADDLE